MAQISTASGPGTAGAAPLPQRASSLVDSHNSRVDVLDTLAGRVLCLADVRGSIASLNALAAEHNAIAIIHTGDFGYIEPQSLPSIADRTLRHLVQYSTLITPNFRAQLLNSSPATMRQLLQDPPRGTAADKNHSGSFFPLSEFPKLVTGEIKLNVPVYAVWGACEDIAILEKIRLAAPSAHNPSPNALPRGPPTYSIPNLTVLDEATTRVLVIGGVRLRLFGLGGAVVSHKLFDNGAGKATIAGGSGTMWTTVLQIGELVDTAQKVYDPTETRVLITHASPGREGLLAQLSLVLKADLTISAGLHFRYGASYNEFSVQQDPDAFKRKLESAAKSFNDVWDTVKSQVESVIDDNQRALLTNALAVANRVPSSNSSPQASEEAAWKNTWNWNLPDSAFGSLIFDIRDGRIGTEMKSQGFNFAYRQTAVAPPPVVQSIPGPLSVLPANLLPPPPTATMIHTPIPVTSRKPDASTSGFPPRNNHPRGASGSRSNLPFHPSNVAQQQRAASGAAATSATASAPAATPPFPHTQGPPANSRQQRSSASGGWGPATSGTQSPIPTGTPAQQAFVQQRKAFGKDAQITSTTSSPPAGSEVSGPSAADGSGVTSKPVRQPRGPKPSSRSSVVSVSKEDGTTSMTGTEGEGESHGVTNGMSGEGSRGGRGGRGGRAPRGPRGGKGGQGEVRENGFPSRGRDGARGGRTPSSGETHSASSNGASSEGQKMEKGEAVPMAAVFVAPQAAEPLW